MIIIMSFDLKPCDRVAMRGHRNVYKKAKVEEPKVQKHNASGYKVFYLKKYSSEVPIRSWPGWSKALLSIKEELHTQEKKLRYITLHAFW